jgi:hypothetical protein
MIGRNKNYVSVYNCLKYNCVQFYGVLTYVAPCTLNQEMVDSQIQYCGCWEREKYCNCRISNYVPRLFSLYPGVCTCTDFTVMCLSKNMF